jgi:hypothetical protein
MMSGQSVPHCTRLTLSKGEVVQGRVLESLPSGSTLLLVRGEELTARGGTALARGAVLTMMVERTSPIPVLKILRISPAGRGRAAMARLLSGLNENLWGSLSGHLRTMALSEQEREQIRSLLEDPSRLLLCRPSPELLKSLVRRSGLGWEAKLRRLLGRKGGGRRELVERLLEKDLKGMLLRRAALEGDTESLPARLASILEQIQLLNCRGLDQEGKIFLPLPFRLQDGAFTMGQLLIRVPEREGGRARGGQEGIYRISLLLEMSELGPVRADLVISGRRIEGRFLVTARSTRTLLEEHLPALFDKLKDKGFTVGPWGCIIKEASIVLKPLLMEMAPDEDHSFDLIV